MAIRYDRSMAVKQLGRITPKAPPRPALEELDDALLLEQRFRDLKLQIKQTLIWPEVEQLHAELQRRGLRFKPHVWLSTEWFSPDGVPGIAVPFFAADARLRRLEQRMTGEVEGGNRKWRLRILRHEAGHAIDTAYRLRRRADWRKVFGKASKPYPQNYAVRPGSRRHVLHLGHWYAQSHPTEDFAETFAVWLQPKARWRRDYQGWPALNKLEYVDRLMAEIGPRRPLNADRSVVAPLTDNSRTLREHYRRKQQFDDINRYDVWIKRVFASRTTRPRAVAAKRFLREMEPELRRSMVRRTKVTPYLVDHTVDLIAKRAGQLDLVLRGPRRDSVPAVKRLHERVIIDMLRRNHEIYAL